MRIYQRFGIIDFNQNNISQSNLIAFNFLNTLCSMINYSIKISISILMV